MRELALFAGAGGGILGGKLLGWDTVCAVEIDDYARRVLLARQRDGMLGRFPIWDDVRTFDGRPWRGHVDIVSGGFPCQAFSQAARGRNNAADMWPEMLRIVGEIRPPYVFAENVKREPIEQAARDLHVLGYGVSIAEASAAAVGAPQSGSDGGYVATPTAAANQWAPSMRKWPGCRALQALFGPNQKATAYEYLMGWPIGWTALEPQEMDKYQQWLRSHGAR